jgi:hypothetical protein
LQLRKLVHLVWPDAPAEADHHLGLGKTRERVFPSLVVQVDAPAR